MEDGLDGGGVEGRDADQKLVDNDAQGPPVHRRIVPTRQNDFGGNVIGGALHLAGSESWGMC